MSGAGSYAQDFDTLTTSTTNAAWADNTTLPNWYAARKAGTGNFNIAANAGGSNSGQLYSYGVGTDTERALGSVGSGTPQIMTYGVLLHNTSGSSLTINSLAYTGEQWRNGAAANSNKLTVSYKKDSAPIAVEPSDLLPAGWTAIATADFTGPITGGTAGALVGNDAANKVAISSNPAITVANGEYVMLRWADPDDAGADQGLAVDNLAISWVVESQPAIVLTATPAGFAENAGATAAVGTVTIPAALGAPLIVTLASSDTTEATVPPTVTIPAGSTSAPFPIAAVDDFLVEANPIPVTLTATVGGYTTGQFQVNVADDGIDTPIGIGVEPDTFSEGAGANAATGTIELAQNTPVDLVVTLTSFDTSEATVPATVTVLANTDSITFPINAVNDTDQDGDRPVTIRATALGYTQGTTSITVKDDGDIPSPPTLSPGAIAFVGFNADGNDNLAFVALTTIAQGDVIYFTDNEWNGSDIGSGGAFNTGEGFITWTAPTGGVAAGAIVALDGLSTATPTANAGSITRSNSFDLGGSGETVYAYQGSLSVATGFLAALTTTDTDSIAGTGLSASHLVTLGKDIDVAAYTGARNTQASFADYLTLIGNAAANWADEDGTNDQSANGTAPDVPFDTTAFTLGSGGSNYGTWASTNGVGGPTQDFDNDGLENLLEYAMGLDPKADSQPAGSLVNGLVSYPKGAEAVANGDVSYKIQTSSTLANGSWLDANPTTNNPSIITYKLPDPSPTVQKVFARLVVTQNP